MQPAYPALARRPPAHHKKAAAKGGKGWKGRAPVPKPKRKRVRKDSDDDSFATDGEDYVPRREDNERGARAGRRRQTKSNQRKRPNICQYTFLFLSFRCFV